MDFPVEATVHLNIFPNETEVRRILRSHGFWLTDLTRDQVRVKGSFLKLKAAKASLEKLLRSQTNIAATQKVSSGAFSKCETNYSSGCTRSQLGSRKKRPPHASPSSPTTTPPWASSDNHSASPGIRPDQRGSFRPGRESFVVDADVFMYAERLRKKDINGILDSHDVRVEVCDIGDSLNVTLLGKSARTAVCKLQSLLNDLSKSLRTQEVPLKDVDREGQALLDTIRKNKNTYNSVLVCQKNDKLHLVGSSGESYELKQRLLARPFDRSGRTGRTFDKISRRRSRSLPPSGRKNTGSDSGAVAYPSPARAAGYSPSEYQGDKAAAGCGFCGATRRRSQSESQEKTQPEKANGSMQDMENKRPPPESPKKVLKQLLEFNPKDIGKQFKVRRK